MDRSLNFSGFFLSWRFFLQRWLDLIPVLQLLVKYQHPLISSSILPDYEPVRESMVSSLKKKNIFQVGIRAYLFSLCLAGGNFPKKLGHDPRDWNEEHRKPIARRGKEFFPDGRRRHHYVEKPVEFKINLYCIFKYIYSPNNIKYTQNIFLSRNKSLPLQSLSGRWRLSKGARAWSSRLEWGTPKANSSTRKRVLPRWKGTTSLCRKTCRI